MVSLQASSDAGTGSIMYDIEYTELYFVSCCAQVLLQAAFLLGNVQWADTHEARLVLQLLGYPKAQDFWHLALVRKKGTRCRYDGFGVSLVLTLHERGLQHNIFEGAGGWNSEWRACMENW